MARPTRDRGAVLPMTVVSILALVGFAALAIDLSWAYLNGERQQRAADAAALAAVVDLPPDNAIWSASTSYGTALRVAGQNGYDPAEVTPQQVFTSGGNLVPNRIKVDVRRSFETFFFDIFGIDTLTLTRTATAEFLPPLQLGSDQPELGAFPDGAGCDPAAPLPGCIDPADPSTWGGTNPGIWVAINGRYTAKEQGDPFTTTCGLSSSPTSCTTGNTEHEARNHYAVEVPSGASTLTVELFDPVFWGNNVSQQIGAGDQMWYLGGEFTTTFTLLAPDSTPANPRDNSVVECSRSFAPDVGAAPFEQGSPTNFRAETLCSLGGVQPGIHVLRVTVDSAAGHAANGFSIRASTDVGSPKVYGIGRMSLRTNQPSSMPIFKLANVPSSYAGRTLTISLFDPGEASGNAWVSFEGQAKDLPCSIVARLDTGGVTGPWTPNGKFAGSACWVRSTQAGVVQYNGDWLDFTFQVPPDYDCDFQAGGCWWEVRYHYSQPGVHDRTTWEVDVKGTPVRLVFDG